MQIQINTQVGQCKPIVINIVYQTYTTMQHT